MIYFVPPFGTMARNGCANCRQTGNHSRHGRLPFDLRFHRAGLPVRYVLHVACIIVTRIGLVVVGVRRSMGRAALGEYTLERLLELARLRDAFDVRDDVLAAKAHALYARVRAV
jgi:hypothetical protein